MLVSKLAALGVAAKAALGVGVAAATMTTASVAGVLPDQAQHAVATAVEAVTSLQLPDPLGSTTTTTLGTGGVGGAGADDDATTDDGSGDGTGQPANHGACVSEVAKDKALTGREHGQTVSAIAQSDCGKKTSSSTTTPTTTVGSTTTTSPTTSTTVANAGSSRGPGSGNSGNANGGNSGNRNAGGNSGNSNGGNSGNSNANGGNSGAVASYSRARAQPAPACAAARISGKGSPVFTGGAPRPTSSRRPPGLSVAQFGTAEPPKWGRRSILGRWTANTTSPWSSSPTSLDRCCARPTRAGARPGTTSTS